ncbi:MAG: hypothetical protein RIB79_00955 [Allomuricauda sp.]|jgi:hypothetical protein
MNRKHLILVVCTIILFSCSKEDAENINEQSVSIIEILVEKSPWTYDRLEVVSIIEKNGFDLKQSHIDDFENNSNQEFNGYTISFNDNGTGTDNDGQFSWTWIDEENGEMHIWDDTYVISVNNTELILGVRNFAFVPEGECCVEIRYDGNIIFK